MTKEHILDIALKIFGIYCVIESIKFFLTLGPLFFDKSYQFWEIYTSKIVFLVSQIPYLLLHLFLAYIFLFRTQWVIRLVGGKEYDTSFFNDSQTSQWQTYGFWIKIIGLFYFVSSAAAIASQALHLVFINSGSHTLVYSSGGSFLTHVIILLLALFFIFKTERVENLITKRNIKET